LSGNERVHKLISGTAINNQKEGSPSFSFGFHKGMPLALGIESLVCTRVIGGLLLPVIY